MTKNGHIFFQNKVVSSLPEGLDALFLVQKLAKEKLSAVHIAKDHGRALQLKSALEFFNPKIKIIYFPAWDCLPYDRVSPNSKISGMRCTALFSMFELKGAPFVCITTVNAIMQRLPPVIQFSSSRLKLMKGNSYNLEKIKNSLVQVGYQSAPEVRSVGEFAIRGGIMDIFSPNDEFPVRLDFFGDNLESLKIFDPVTQVSIRSSDSLVICPIGEYYLSEDQINAFRRNYRVAFQTNGLNDPLYQSISVGRNFLGFEHWGPLFYNEMKTLFDYLPKRFLFSIDCRVEDAMWERWQFIKEQYKSRKESQSSPGEKRKKIEPLSPELLYIPPAEVALSRGSGGDSYSFNPMKLPVGYGSINFGGFVGRSFSFERREKSVSLFEKVVSHIKLKLAKTPVAIACYSEGSKERIKNILKDNDFQNFRDIRNFSDLYSAREIVGLVLLNIEKGFESSVITVISEMDILGDRVIRSPLLNRNRKDFLKDLSEIEVDDLIVHVEHGLGKYIGLEKIKTLGVQREYIGLEYLNKDKLLIPIENIELLNRYGQEEGQLDKLGSTSWQKRKTTIKRRVFELADRLIKLQAERTLRKGVKFLQPDYLWQEFCARFPYEETEDQLNSINDVVSDLASGRPMDRLICGDVGFGKTEIAMRAAFLVASAGKQVAVITPTTLLCRQHFFNFKDRFRDLPIQIEMLSRFVSSSRAKKVRNGLDTGTVDIIIGTHSLLANNIGFNDLGLVIIDEEQHFGVVHKERLKQIKSDVHVLTLTATPIPRTLQLALSGVRELSIIATPPVDRYAIRTFVSEFDELTIKDALMREHFRGGQSFFVVPRVRDISSIEVFLKDNLTELRVGVAHGKMASKELDVIMEAFYDRQFDVLLCTSIIESGLDLPGANTIIVNKAEMFGLAQLYQIRGRVGRGKIRAYAYLLTDARKTITMQAEKRLQVISNIETLGAGFSLASHDLDIRGAGNLLGDEQSGQIKEVGFELYKSMLEEAVKNIKEGKLQHFDSLEDKWSPEINLNISALIPSYFVPDLNLRLNLYRRLSNIAEIEDIDAFAVELVDRFGSLPKELSDLLKVMKIKNKCLAAKVSKLEAGPKGLKVKFWKDEFSNPDELLQYIHSNANTLKVIGNELIFKIEWKSNDEKLERAYNIVSDLAQCST
ncbi:MAG: transcription-repair coupling factor [Pseudomonadota bacterium]|nr:transcription-repair coupling factor [Pseudomonadota bacterium]